MLCFWRLCGAFGATPRNIESVQDDTVGELCQILEPCRQRGWLRSGIDLVSTVALHPGLLIGQVHIKRGLVPVDAAKWDGLTLEALIRAFFDP